MYNALYDDLILCYNMESSASDANVFIDQASILLSYFNLEEALEVESAQGNNDAVTFIDLYSNYKSQQEVTNIKSKTFKTKAEFDRAVAEQVMFYKEYSLNHI